MQLEQLPRSEGRSEGGGGREGGREGEGKEGGRKEEEGAITGFHSTDICTQSYSR